MKFSIYFRVFLPFALAIVVVVIGSWWTATTLLTDALAQRLDDQLDHATTVLARGTFPFTAELIDQVANLQNADFALLRKDGTVALTSLDPSSHDTLAMIEMAWRDESNPRGRHYEIVFHRLPEGRNREYVAVAGIASLDDVQAAGRRAAWWIGILAVAATAIMALIGHRISSGIAMPLRQLGTMARKIAAGDRDVRTHVGSITEIGELTIALNDMTTKLAAYEEEIVATNRLASLGEVAARVAHEIRNPLTAMRLQAQLLQERLAGREEGAIAGRLLTEMQRLDLIVASTLALSRPVTVNLEQTELNRVVGEVAELMKPQFEHRHIDLDWTLGDVSPGPLDVDRFKQVIFNLLTNAADALPDGGKVHISTSQDERCTRLVIEDSGPGLERSSFDHPVTSSKSLGLGVGLVIARELVELHHGTIQVSEGQSLGGARFTIELPNEARA